MRRFSTDGGSGAGTDYVPPLGVGGARVGAGVTAGVGRAGTAPASGFDPRVGQRLVTGEGGGPGQNQTQPGKTGNRTTDFTAFLYKSSHVIPAFTLSFKQNVDLETHMKRADFFMDAGVNHFVAKMYRNIGPKVIENFTYFHDRVDLECVGMRYPLEIDLKKTADENFANLLWVKKTDDLLRKEFNKGKLKYFATHFNVTFQGWEGMQWSEIGAKLSEIENMLAKLDLGDDGLDEVVAFAPYGTNDELRKADVLKIYEVFSMWKLAFDMDMLKVYESNLGKNPEQTAYRFFMKELFKYNDHVNQITFREYSLLKLYRDQMDPRKHISVDTLIDFFKIANFRGIINYEFDFKEQEAEQVDYELLSEYISLMNAKLVSNGYAKMGKFEYIRFMEFMKLNPAYNSNQYIVL